MTRVSSIMIGRRGSVGLPGKNMLVVKGRPLSWWPLAAARAEPRITAHYVSTDDPDLALMARGLGCTVIERPAELASREALGEDAYRHAHKWITDTVPGSTPEIYVLLMANAPTVTTRHISQGIDALECDPLLDSAVTVSPYNMWSPLRARRLSEDGLLKPMIQPSQIGDEALLNCDRDSQGDVYFADMGVSVVRARNLEDLESGLLPQRWMGRRIHPLFNEAGVDVDYEYQLGQVEWWLARNAR